MWHQLVLHGIGGRTIAEAKRNISVVEFYHWCSYINLRGTLNVAEKLESVGGLLTEWIIRTGYKQLKKNDGTEFSRRDFMPHACPLVDEEQSGELTMQSVLAVIGGMGVKKRG